MSDPVERTNPDIEARLARDGEMSVAWYTEHPEGVAERLRELDAEWDVERALTTASATLTLASLTLGLGASRKWLLLTVIVQGLFAQKTLAGTCPPLPVLRHLGFRTSREIERERQALLRIQGPRGSGSAESSFGRADGLLTPAGVSR